MSVDSHLSLFLQADTLNHHNGYDVVVLYRRKHVNGVSYFAYGTPGLGELFVSGTTDIGKTYIDMFEAFYTKYGDRLIYVFLA